MARTAGFANPVDPDSLLNVLYTTTKPSEQIEINNQLAGYFLNIDPGKSGEYANQAMFLSESIHDRKGKAVALYYIALLEEKASDFNNAIDHLKISLNIFRNEKDIKWIANVELALSDEYKRRLEFEKALDFGYKALEKFNRLNNAKKIAETYKMIAGNYYDQANYSKAGEFFRKSLTVYEQIGDEEDIAVVTHNIGEVFRVNNKPDEAIRYFKKAINVFKSSGNYTYLATAYDNIGNIYLHGKQFDSAYYYLKQSYRISRQLNLTPLMAEANLSMGEYLLATGYSDSALVFLKNAVYRAKEVSRFLLERDAFKDLSGVYQGREQYDSAYFYHKLYKDISDSISNIRSQHKIAQIEMNYIYDHEQQLAQIQQHNTLLKYFTLAGGLFFILVILILLYSRQRIIVKHSRKEAASLQLEQKHLQEELDFKNRELTTHVMFLVNQNELINLISEKLLKTRSYFNKENKKKIQQIIFDLQKNIDKDIWMVFEQRFREVHSEFYGKLNDKFPNLTENDKKLCAFLRLNLSTKEISLILHQNPNSIEVARTRLRKKLNISGKDISLTRFLAQL